MLIQKRKKMKDRGLLGAAKTTTKAPYKRYARTPDMFAYGSKSAFITPKTAAKRAKSPRGIKR